MTARGQFGIVCKTLFLASRIIYSKQTSRNNEHPIMPQPNYSCQLATVVCACGSSYSHSYLLINSESYFSSRDRQLPSVISPTKRREFHEDHLLRHGVSRFKSTKAQSKSLKSCVHRELQNQCINNLQRSGEHFQSVCKWYGENRLAVLILHLFCVGWEANEPLAPKAVKRSARNSSWRRDSFTQNTSCFWIMTPTTVSIQLIREYID